MRRVHTLALIVLSGLVAACQGEPGSGPGSGNTGELRGGERLGWDQQADDADQLASLRFRLWVDDQGQEMSGVSCGPLSGSRVSTCSGVLPAMTGGPHTLAVSAVAADGTEGSRSATLQVTVVASGTNGKLIFHESLPSADGGVGTGGAAQARPPGSRTVAGSLEIETLVDDLEEPTDVVAVVDGRVFVSERRGTVRVLSDGILQSASMLTLDDVSTIGGSGLLSLAPDPDFARNGFMYVGYTADTGFRVARYRVAAGTLGERSIMFETAPDRPYTAAVVRFGPDRQLYVALDDEGDAQRSGDLGAVSGKVLRLNTDGSVPADQAGFSPVYATNLRAPRSLAWSPSDHALWVAEGDLDTAGLLTVLKDETTVRRRADIAARYALADGDLPAAALFYNGAAFTAWTGDLLLGSSVSGQLLRLRLDPADATRIAASEVVLDGTMGPIRALTTAANGSVYVAGERTLVRLRPAGS